MDTGRFMTTIAGLVATFVGWAIWQEPHLDWTILISSTAGEMYRLANDPFAILGLIIMFLGLGTLVKTLTPNKV